VLSGKFIAMNAYIRSTEKSQINDLMLYLKLLENKNKLNPKTVEGERLNSAQINEMEIKRKHTKNQ
jgi:hypothetical protein